MKRINLIVLMFAVALFSGFLLKRNSTQLEMTESGLLQNRSITHKAPVAFTSNRAENPLQSDIASVAALESTPTLVSSSGSMKVVSGGPDLPVGQEQSFYLTGLKEETSNVHVAVFESEAGFPNSDLSSRTVVVSATKDSVQFSLELPRDRPVAIAVFQDIDGNGKLSKNQVGIPTEPYGFSNNARGLLGPPSFGQAAFTISNGERAKPIEIKLR